MKHLLAGSGRRLLQATAAALVVLAIGVVNATGVAEIEGLAVVFLLAAGAAGWKFVQEVVPAFSWATLGVPQPYAAYLDAFTQGALGSLTLTVPDLFDATDLATARALALAAIQGALTAGFRAVEGLFTKGEFPAPSKGVGPRGP